MGLKIFTIDFAELSNYKFIRNDVRFFVGQKVRFLNKGIRLGKIFETGRGRVINQEYVKENEGEYPIYSSQTSDEGIFGYIDTYDFEGEYLTWTTDGYAGRVFYRNGKFNCTNVCGTAKLKKEFQNKINLKFLSFFLNLYTPFYVSIASGNPKLMNNVFEEIKIPLIPKSQQDQIVAQIEPIEKKIKELKSTIRHPQEIINEVFAREFGFDVNLYNEFGKGMTAGTQIAKDKSLRIFETGFEELSRSKILRFSTRFHNPPTKKLMDFLDSIETLQVKDVVDSYEKGVQPNYNSDGEIPVVKITNLKNGYIDFSESEFVTEKYYNNLDKKKKLKQNDIIICATGKVSLGKIDFYDYEIDAITTVDNYIIRLKENYNPLFFTYFFRSILGYFQIERDFTGTTNQIHLYWEQISNFQIPNISLSEQQKIVDEIKAELDKQEEIKKQIEQERNKIDEIIEEVIK
jgi:type I restriction enzyme S subunit